MQHVCFVELGSVLYNVKERAIGRKDVACTSEPGFTGVEKVKGGLLDVLPKKQNKTKKTYPIVV